MRKGVLEARALALAIALTGVTVGPGGVATATSPRARRAGETLSTGGETLALRLTDRRVAAWDNDPDSGDGGDGDDGDDDDADD